jgi:hypothetical protein
MKTLTADEAAKYIGCKSAAQFRREVKAGIWPEPIAPDSRPQRWSIPQLDAALSGGSNGAQIDPHVSAFEKRMGMT